ncbi:MAG: sigma-70 family RNA polymerase sigma factor [Oscillospiraceae bacterium]|jgi:RNA polymerase sigma factor (sigma-70 family)
MPALWGQIERFVRQQANRIVNHLGGRCGVEFDDLYQSGYIAMVQAVDSYKPEKENSFIGWMAFYIKTAFAEAAGYRSRGRNPLDLAVSLDMPLSDDADTLCDIVADPRNPYDAVEDRIYTEQLHDVLEEAISTLPAETGTVVHAYYLEGCNISDIAEQNGVECRTVRQRKETGLRQLRQVKRTSSVGKRLYSFVEARTPYYFHVGAERFNITGTSAVEEAVFIREKLLRDLQGPKKEVRG